MTQRYQNIAIIILAAGGSTRLGHPKQLVEVEGIPLIRRVADQALNTGSNEVVIVLGSGYEVIQQQIIDLNVSIALNTDWQSGLSSSIRAGINAVKNKDQLSGLMFLLSDQPFVTLKHLRELSDLFLNTPNQIAATAYQDTIGVPAIFDTRLVPELLKLSGDQGAGKLIRKNKALTSILQFDPAGFDVDKEEDVTELKRLWDKSNSDR